MYNIIFEDTQIDRIGLKISENDRIYTICAAGDHLLIYLLDNPELIVATDLNKYQIYLAELKIAMIKICTQAQYFKIFGQNDYDLFIIKYKVARDMISEQAKYYWDNNQDTAKSWAYSGSSGMLAKLLASIYNIDSIKNITREQSDLFVDIFIKLHIIVAAIPDTQFKKIPSSKIKKYIFESLKKLGVNIDDSYVYKYYLNGFMTEECCLPYMKKGNYEYIKERVDRIRLHHGYLEETITRYDKSFTIFCGLDSLDWITDIQIENILSIITRQMGSGKMLLRSLKPFKEGGYFTPILNKFERVEEIKYDLDICPSYFFNGVVYFNRPLLTTCSNIKNPDIMEVYPKVLTTMIQKGIEDIFSKKNNNSFVVDYYKNQAQYYDLTRYALLANRYLMMKSLKTEGRWLDFACGTGSNFEFLSSEQLKRYDEIILCDLSPDLLDVATNRIKRLHMKNAKTLCQDILEYDDKQKFDLITISFSLTMISQWDKIIEKCYNMLNKNGHIYVCDFIYQDEYIQDKFWKIWFGMNHVAMNQDHVIKLKNTFKTMFYNVYRCDIPMLPSNFQCSQYLFIGKKI